MMVDPIARPFGKFHRAICFPARKKKREKNLNKCTKFSISRGFLEIFNTLFETLIRLPGKNFETT